MSGVVSFRTTRVERERMRVEMREMGLAHLSEYVRYKLGLPAILPMAADDAQDSELTSAKVVQLIVNMLQGQDDVLARLNALCRKQGIAYRETVKPQEAAAQLIDAAFRWTPPPESATWSPPEASAG
jgi:hypothetical protein